VDEPTDQLRGRRKRSGSACITPAVFRQTPCRTMERLLVAKAPVGSLTVMVNPIRRVRVPSLSANLGCSEQA
jgi:hypothetical protein